eukprot:CAMPEP_0197185838 /NCGR_PEP_ID=MMETSP1423-20130617/12787_1 /TAXON_ID=476441 /ORGANISM="Pseudo-nitzschia heimii, Strain UNC1101" /LENGTH=998 /DNA_ID=CAMNT_0042636997 /DNA_START=248 /DNA_END=3244 /DNA_ORIENTATION=-
MRTFFLAFLSAWCVGITLAEETKTIVLPNTYKDDLFHCADPTSTANIIPCDPTTFLWNLNALKPNYKPDESTICQEVVGILVRAREQEAPSTPGRLQAQTQKDVQVWESIMEASVIDELEPCVLWSMSFGLLAPWAPSMRLDSGQHQQHVEINDNSDPLESLLETAFDTIVIGLVWEDDLDQPLSLNRNELHDLTGRHIMDSLRAELGADNIEHLDLTVTAGLPDYQAKVLPLNLSGKVVFNDPRQSLGPSSLQRVIVNVAFKNDNARDLYLFRLKIARDPTLQEVHAILQGRAALTDFILRPTLENAPNRASSEENLSQQFIDTSDMNLSEEDEGLVSILLVAILSAVAAAIIAVVCFAYFLICRSRTSDNAAKTLEENSHGNDEYIKVAQTQGGRSGRKPQKDSATNNPKQDRDKTSGEYQDGLPAVQTAPTETVEEDEYDIEYVAGSHVDDGVSDYEMDTLPPPSSLPDSDDDSIVMSVVDGFEDENLGDEEAGKNQNDDSDMSDANTSLYNYIPDDTSLSIILKKKETTLEKTQKKGLLWSVIDHQPPRNSDHSDKDGNRDDSDMYGSDKLFDGSDISTELSYNGSKGRSSILGPSSDNDETQSRDSNSLLYATDEDTAITPLSSLSGHRHKEIPYAYKNNNEKAQQPPRDQGHQEMLPHEEPTAAREETSDKKKKFEELWRNENEIDEVASVLQYLDSAQSARRSTETETPPTTNMKIVKVATPIQTPNPPSLGDGESGSVKSSNQPVSESVVDRVPETTDSEDNRMNLPLPATLQDACSSVSSGVSRPASQKHPFPVGESARRNKSNKWIRSSSSVASSGSSVCSTDSAKLRSLLGQSDTNDAAIVFGKQQQSQNQPRQTQHRKNDENSLGSNSIPDTEISMSSCTSSKLESLLTRNDGRDAGSDDGDRSEDFLFNATAQQENPDTRRQVQEEKKDGDEEEEKTSYLPHSITPRVSPIPSTEFGSPDDASTFSAMSEAPSVDETIKSGMGWF